MKIEILNELLISYSTQILLCTKTYAYYVLEFIKILTHKSI